MRPASLLINQKSARRFVQPMNGFAFVALLLCALFVILTIYPLLISTSKLFDSHSWLEISEGISSATLRTILVNTLIIVGSATALALLLGGALAWIDERTDGALPGFGRIMALAPLLVPPIAGVMGWAVLLDPNAGLLNHLLRWALEPFGFAGTRGPLNIFTPAALLLLTALYLVPYAYLILAAALRQLDPSLEEAARINQAGPFKTLIVITLPSISPAIGSAAIVTLISGLGLFSVPFIIGASARMDVISVYIFRLLDSYPPRPALALSLAAFLFVIVQALLWAQRRLAQARRYAAIGGRGQRTALVRLGKARILARSSAIIYIFATAILPLGALLLVSLQPFWTPSVQWSNLSLENYRIALFQTGATSRALINSLSLAALTATLTMASVGALMVYAQTFNRKIERYADLATSLPATLPHTVIGVCFILAFSGGLLNLYGTQTLLLLAYIVMALPFAGRAAASASSAIGKDLAEASRTFGAGEGRTFWRIMLPLALPGLAAGWAIIFIHTAGEVTASALLAGSKTPVIGRVLMDLWNYGSFPQVAALALIMASINACVIGLVLRLSKRGLGAMLS
ncbi:MAG: iron ABC transporter permease [Alphaproteobacteria bacterium]|nr:iron ABC transporter permease [Alphaproteobacteria bacterium]